MNIAAKIKQLRIKCGYSQEELAARTGLSLRTIQRVENEETIPRGYTLKKLSEALDAPDILLDREQQNILKEDNQYLAALNLSALSFLLFPLLGVIIPFILYVLKRDSIQGVEQVGKKIINFQLVWLILLVLVCCTVVFLEIGDFKIPFFKFGRPEFLMLLIPVSYLYNILFVVVNAFRVSRIKS